MKRLLSILLCLALFATLLTGIAAALPEEGMDEIPAADTQSTPAEEPVEEPAEEPAREPAVPAAEEGKAEEPAPAPATDAPNANPVQLGAAEAPVGEDGKLDPTRIASPEDFGNWDDLGCRG